MIVTILADTGSQSWNPFASFGVTSWEPLVSNLIAFILMIIILRIFAFKPIREMLQKRKDRIAEAEYMRAESERKLASVQKEAKEILVKAGQEGQEQVVKAKEAASKLLQSKEEEAARMARDMIARSEEAVAIETKQAREELKKDFVRMVALATAQVSGKVLTDEDHRRINQELIQEIKS